MLILKRFVRLLKPVALLLKIWMRPQFLLYSQDNFSFTHWFDLTACLNRLADFAKLYDVIKNERNKCVNLIQTSTQVSCVHANETRQKIWMKSLKKSNEGVVRALFHLKWNAFSYQPLGVQESCRRVWRRDYRMPRSTLKLKWKQFFNRYMYNQVRSPGLLV